MVRLLKYTNDLCAICAMAWHNVCAGNEAGNRSEPEDGGERNHLR